MPKLKTKTTVLSPREQAVLDLLLEPVEMKEISYRLGISYKTAHSYATTGSEKLGFKTVAEALRSLHTRNIVERCAAIAASTGAHQAAEQMRLAFSLVVPPPPANLLHFPSPESSVTGSEPALQAA